VDLIMAVAGLGVGFVVGLTGMGGGALMTPVLMVVFGVPPLAAVSSDLVVAAVMKPVGGVVHLRRGTVAWPVVAWLAAGSIPGAFSGVLVIRALGHGEDVAQVVRIALGCALLLASAGLFLGSLLPRRAEEMTPARVSVRPVPTLMVGLGGGLVVGMTSVGSGCLMILALLLLYPGLSMNRLVGTDLVQAVPLVVAAAVGHLLFGDVQWGLVSSLLLGAIPGAWMGSRMSSRAPESLVRGAVVVVLVASGTKLLGVDVVLPTLAVGMVLVITALRRPVRTA
jgi:uncharacterized membrane protein YfcA